METLTYSYGETPEEVVRERLAAAEFDGKAAHIYCDSSGIGCDSDLDLSTDDLLTVLDALKNRPQMVWGDERHPEVPADRESRKAAKSLRISILSALGIEES